MSRCLWTIVGITCLTAISRPAAGIDTPAKVDPAEVEFFETKVRPVLETHCIKCHGPSKQKGGLRLDSLDAMRTGGDSGPVLMAGDPEKSLLIEAVRYDGEPRMPPDRKMKDTEIQSLTNWIKRGAHWPAARTEATTTAKSGRVITEKDRAFWAFQPIQGQPQSAVRDSQWPTTSIDRFILARLEEAGLDPSPQADRRTLIRRLTFDLIGLPPTPEEVEAFVADQSPDAYERLVERLLASPQYGERLARHWLDVARYGEDQAHSFQPRLYPNGWRYRDWLVKSFNSDLPYDEFLTSQIAGDLIERPGKIDRLPALGFFACGPVYYGDEKKLDQIDDRIDTLTRGVLGLTVSCARCHDHKFDPITQADYYGLAGVFASTEYEETPLAADAEVKLYNTAKSAFDAKEKDIEGFLKKETHALMIARATESARYLKVLANLDKATVNDPKRLAKVAKDNKLDAELLGRWAKFARPDGGDGPKILADWNAARKGDAKAIEAASTRFASELAMLFKS